MKTNLLTVLAAFLFLTSCSRGDDTIEEIPQETSFFNLKVGNEWVYKTYDRVDYNSEFKFSGKIDTLKIISEVTLNNKKYAKVKHSNRSDYYEYWRVNDKGHLVNLSDLNFISGNDSQETVTHPGKDFSYSHKEDYEIHTGLMGTLVYNLYQSEVITVEGHQYKVSPYKGLFTPSAQNPSQISKIVNRDYVENIGLIRFANHAITGTSNYEDRLVSYKIK